MFEMTVEDVTIVFGHTTVSGKCKNIKCFTTKLVDDKGKEYKAFIPFIKHVIRPENDYITLELAGVSSPNTLKGQVLRGLSQ